MAGCTYRFNNLLIYSCDLGRVCILAESRAIIHLLFMLSSREEPAFVPLFPLGMDQEDLKIISLRGSVLLAFFHFLFDTRIIERGAGVLGRRF